MWSNRDTRNSKTLKTKWCISTCSNRTKGSRKYTRRRRSKKRSGKVSSSNWPLKRLWGANNRKWLKTLGTSCPLRNMRNRRGRRRELNSRKKRGSRWSCSLLRNIRRGWKRRGSWKSWEWRRISKTNLWWSSLKMNALNRWTLRKEGWRNKNTNAKLKDSGKKN